VYYSPADAEISPLKPWDEEKGIYYVEITFPKPVYARTYVQFAVYYYENKLWDSSNDFSYEGLGDTYKILENIPVYKDGVQVSGKDPSGGEPSATTKPSPTTGFSVSGCVVPDFLKDLDTESTLKSGFKVEIVGTSLSDITDEDGCFEIKNVPENASGYTIKISKPVYLYREIKDVSVTKDVQVSTKNTPIYMWAGDMVINGVQDNAINMTDIMQIATSFNTSKGNAKYVEIPI
jgi:hypothetical protein